MKVLLLNTCGAEGTLALADTDLAKPIVRLRTMPGRQASEMLVAALREAMDEAAWKLRDLAAIAVVTGPGSFTGVRVGLSVAKGLSESSGVPLIAVSRLALLAAAVDLEGLRVCALLDAGRDEFYLGEFEGPSMLGEALVSRQAAVDVGSSMEVAVACEDSVFQKLGDSFLLRMIDEPTAADALPLALRLLAGASFDDPMTLDANYLRRTDAEIFAKPAARRS
jgi:tRNA threonylcarbamoyladenosine biosynthesis protein TsaB